MIDKTWMTLCFFLGSFIVFGSCRIGNRQEFSHVVVERSKRETPTWTALPTGKLIPTSEGFQFIQKKQYILNLFLGLKQIQSQAIEAANYALNQEVLEALKARRGLPDRLSFTNPQLLSGITEQVVERVSRKFMVVTDIYYEKLVDESSGAGGGAPLFYDGYILLTVQGSVIPEILEELGKTLESVVGQELSLHSAPNWSF
jgi:hypothetical protein